MVVQNGHMFTDQRLKCLDQVYWNGLPNGDPLTDSIRVLECWKYEGVASASHGLNYRTLTLANEYRPKNTLKGTVEERLNAWLQHKLLAVMVARCVELAKYFTNTTSAKSPYGPPLPPENFGKPQGGLRLLLCDRNNMHETMTISRHAFEMIEEAFDLHPATLPSLALVGGVYARFVEKAPGTGATERIRIVVKATQKVEIANYTLSLCHHVATGWTDAWICGDGVTRDRPIDAVFGSQYEQLIEAIIGIPTAWNNALTLPCVLLRNLTQRILDYTEMMNVEISDVESRLGVTNAGSARTEIARERWPQDVDAKGLTIALHSILPQVGFLSKCCVWLYEYKEFLLQLEDQLRADEAFENQREGFAHAKESIEFLSSMIVQEKAFFDNAKERATWQVNVLYSVISQQENILNRLFSRLQYVTADATKQDSISMATFTFITALFLPGTFVATFFSMTMFNWDPADQSPSSSSTSASPFVSDKLWIFWVVVLPLTAATMTGWRFWSQHARSQWRKKLNANKEGMELDSFSI